MAQMTKPPNYPTHLALNEELNHASNGPKQVNVPKETNAFTLMTLL
jgi:hypothetical protein